MDLPPPSHFAGDRGGPLPEAISGSTDPSLQHPTRKWVVESPSPNWSHHLRRSPLPAGMKLATGDLKRLLQI
ncbi:hypothetical protein EYF80_062939 [Liparis tanakae]|uniref:Uncharacterized protein n=1 Tax=Liparis tanakae TaxID=230148 RepID=A0A4Z2EEE0_9TELE|nr:hypothetical protein EYF80_062939 [Liparis tanakae]